MTIAIEIVVVTGVLVVLYDNLAVRRRLKAVTANCAPRFNARGEVASLAMINLAGKPANLDLRGGRFIVAVIDPSCESCALAIQEAQHATNVLIVSVADIAQTRKLLGGLQSAQRTFVIDRGNGRREFYGGIPQIFAVEQGSVVRTCATVRECS